METLQYKLRANPHPLVRSSFNEIAHALCNVSDDRLVFRLLTLTYCGEDCKSRRASAYCLAGLGIACEDDDFRLKLVMLMQGHIARIYDEHLCVDIARAWAVMGTPEAHLALLGLIMQEDAPAIGRATAGAQLAATNYPTELWGDKVAALIYHDDPLVRAAADAALSAIAEREG